jgi:hypothetical protein
MLSRYWMAPGTFIIKWFAEKSKGYWGEIQIDALYLK